MTSPPRDRLYNLLPALYRVRDVAEGEPLRALLGIMEQELGVLEQDIDGLYQNWFIETCEEWVVAYIGDLLGVRPLHPISSGVASLRPYVANTIAYRRRKGTAPVLEQLARDVTGWPARAVEFFQLLETTQHVNHVRPGNVRTPDLRDTNHLELLNGPFHHIAHTGEVRNIASGRGRYNIPNVGVFLWRLGAYEVARGAARPAIMPPDGRHTFDPTGLDAPLFNRGRTETRISQLAQEADVPGPLRRRALYEELEARRQAMVDGSTVTTTYFGASPVLQVFVDGSPSAVPPEEVLICDLSAWGRPGSTRDYTPSGGGPAQSLPISVAVDPVLGRLAFPLGVTPAIVETRHLYGFPGDVGAGPYDRQEAIEALRAREPDWTLDVAAGLPPVPDQQVATLAEAVQAWNAQAAGTVGLITILDSRSYVEDLVGASAITIPEGSRLMVVAADRQRPHLQGFASVRGTAPGGSSEPGALEIDGLLIQGVLTVLVGNLGGLTLGHSTLVPGAGGLVVNPSAIPGQQNAQLRVTWERSLGGPITLNPHVPFLSLKDCLVASTAGGDPAGAAISAPGAGASLDGCTVLGTAVVRSLEASDCIFTGAVNVERRQTGCVRFSHVPPGSRVPRRYRCQPEIPHEATPAEQAALAARIRPVFTSTLYGHPGYGQLALQAAIELRRGASDEGEMGAFHFLQAPQREANLRATLEEYLRFGLQAGIFFVT